MVKSSKHSITKQKKDTAGAILKSILKSTTAFKKQTFKEKAKKAKKEYIWKMKVGEYYRAITLSTRRNSNFSALPIGAHEYSNHGEFICGKISTGEIMGFNLNTFDVFTFKRFEKCIFDHKRPKKTLRDSAFLAEYDKFDRESITKKMIRNILPSKLQSRMRKEMGDDIEEICVWLWSLGSATSGLYKKMNKALYADDREKIKQYMPIISGLNQYLVRKVKKDMETWRGSKMITEQFNIFEIGKIYRCPAIAATSLDKNVALRFKDKYMFKFVIPSGTWNSADISALSHYEGEKEVLFPPYSAFKIVSIKETTITAEVLDNKTVSLSVPSVFI